MQTKVIGYFSNSPVLVRVLPFVVFVFLTFLQGKLGQNSEYWLYMIKSVVGLCLILSLRRWIPELSWKFSLQAVVAGVLVFILWIGLDGVYPELESLSGLRSRSASLNETGAAWNPLKSYEGLPALGWLFVIIRIWGSSYVVPQLEEVFFRSFLYRYLISADFLNISLGSFRLGAFIITSVIFGLEHREWLPGILCGMIYQWLVIKNARISDAVTAHAITNFLLGLYIVWQGQWHFW